MENNTNTNTEIITTLIKLGADVNAKDDAGLTALMYAEYKQNNEAKAILTRAGARE